MNSGEILNLKVLGLLILIQSGYVTACTCLGDKSSVQLEHYEKYNYIARAEIDTTDSKFYKFHIKENFKNALPDVLVYRRGGNTSCSKSIGWAGDKYV